MVKCVWLLLLLLAWAASLSAQESARPVPADSLPAADTARPAADLARKKAVTPEEKSAKPESRKGQQAGEEFELEAIAIQAVVEKPNVEIIPKRAKPALEETRLLERSFERELKQVPAQLLSTDEELDRAHRLEELGSVKKNRKQ